MQQRITKKWLESIFGKDKVRYTVSSTFLDGRKFYQMSSYLIKEDFEERWKNKGVTVYILQHNNRICVSKINGFPIISMIKIQMNKRRYLKDATKNN
jgi:hypothetical protein